MQTYLIDNSTRELSKKEKFESYKGKEAVRKKKRERERNNFKIKSTSAKSFVSL